MKYFTKTKIEAIALKHINRVAERKGIIKKRFWHRLLHRTNYNKMLRGRIDESAKVIFVTIPKTAITSIVASLQSNYNLENKIIPLIRSRTHRWPYGEHQFYIYNDKSSLLRKIGFEEIKKYFTFTFVRNPFDRLVSCWQNVWTLHPKNKRFIFAMETFSYMQKVSNFTDLVDKLTKVPNKYLEFHLRPQFLFIEKFQKKGGKIDFIGHFEDLEKDFGILQKRFGFPTLEKKNASALREEKQSWHDYYTPETAKLIYKRFQKDFELFGYEDEYPKLLDYLKKKKKTRNFTKNKNTL